MGSTFGMSMKVGIPYSMTNTVVEFEENRRIAWEPRLSGKIFHRFGGRIWRYELEPVDGGTRGARELGHLRRQHQGVGPLAAEEDAQVDGADARSHRGARHQLELRFELIRRTEVSEV